MINISRLRQKWLLPPRARKVLKSDHGGILFDDPGAVAVIEACTAWLCRAQDCSATSDGGAARDFHLINGWSSSYPETSGYIVPTLIEYARRRGDGEVLQRARKMLDWLVSIQLPGGGFQGGVIDASPVVPVTFNTGQILFALCSGVEHFGPQYEPAMSLAGAWLRDSLDDDGCWRQHPTPFAEPGEKVYETHVAWALLEAARLDETAGYGEAGLANVDWALSYQEKNGWFARCCLNKPDEPLTHTIGYALRGIVEAFLYSQDERYLDAARRTASSLQSVINQNGYLPGRLKSDWTPSVDWVCLTGTVQIAICWLLLFRAEGNAAYADAARAANRFVRRTILLSGDLDQLGGVKGSYPVDGDYGRYQYLNWAAKFCVDSNQLEIDVLGDS